MSPRLDIEGTHNFRDVGDYPATGGRTRKGQLYRSDALSRITPAGVAELAALRIGVVVDLRSDLELSQDRSANVLPGARLVSIPIHGGSRSSIIDDGVISPGEPLPAGPPGVGLVAGGRCVGHRRLGRTPVLVNCTAGKDRTGLVIALALEVAGVDRTAVIADYTQSALNLDGLWVNRTLTSLVSHGVPISPRLFEVIGGSPDHAMSNLLTWLDKEYGSVTGYLVAHGMAPEAIEELHEKLVAAP